MAHDVELGHFWKAGDLIAQEMGGNGCLGGNLGDIRAGQRIAHTADG